jgi:hypothetical protein
MIVSGQLLELYVSIQRIDSDKSERPFNRVSPSIAMRGFNNFLDVGVPFVDREPQFVKQG